MKPFSLLIVFAIVFSESPALAANQQADTAGQHILIINAFDQSDSKIRKNKKELFTELTDSLKEYLHTFLFAKHRVKATIIGELIKDTSASNMVVTINQHKATMALVITSLNVYFKQTGVVVTKDSDGKKDREASYDICCTVTYYVYGSNVSSVPSEEKNCKFFTKRNVTSGLLAAGPDVVGKKKYTFEMVRNNAYLFIYGSDFFK